MGCWLSSWSSVTQLAVLDVLVAVAFVRLEQRGHEEINLQHIHAHYMDLKKANADGIPNFSLDNIQVRRRTQLRPSRPWRNPTALLSTLHTQLDHYCIKAGS